MKNSANVHFRSESIEWETPQFLYEGLHAEFGFELDPCSTHENAKCKQHFTKSENGLLQDWGQQTVFVNPPYGREIKSWIKKSYEASLAGALVVCLIPARTDTSWWHQYVTRGEIRFLRGRLRFGGAINSASFPSVIVLFNRPRCGA